MFDKVYDNNNMENIKFIGFINSLPDGMSENFEYSIWMMYVL